MRMSNAESSGALQVSMGSGPFGKRLQFMHLENLNDCIALKVLSTRRCSV